eukprot:366350-Chlamydomonas_euryale.AAC.5
MLRCSRCGYPGACGSELLRSSGGGRTPFRASCPMTTAAGLYMIPHTFAYPLLTEPHVLEEQPARSCGLLAHNTQETIATTKACGVLHLCKAFYTHDVAPAVGARTITAGALQAGPILIM